MFDLRGKPATRARHGDTPEHRPASESTRAESSETETTPPQTPATSNATPLPPLAKLMPMRWAEAQRRMGDYDVESCPRCGARLAPVVVVLDPDEIRRTLEMRAPGGPVELLSQAPSRGPPQGQLPLPFVVRDVRRAPATA
jgi:hypothetical protein